RRSPTAIVRCATTCVGSVARRFRPSRSRMPPTWLTCSTPRPSPARPWSQAVREYGEAEDAAIEAGDLDAASEINVRFWVDGVGRTSDEVDAGVRSRVHEMQRRALELQVEAGDAAEEHLLADDVDR